MKSILVLILYLNVSLVMVGCKNDSSKDSTTFEDKLKIAQAKGVFEGADFPEWLVIRINEVENRPSSITKVQIYKGECNRQAVYYIKDTFSSCFCDFYTEDGERMAGNLSDVRATGKNWILIYEYGELSDNL